MFNIFKKKKIEVKAPKVVVRIQSESFGEIETIYAYQDLEFDDVIIREIKLTNEEALKVDFDNFELADLSNEIIEEIGDNDVQVIYQPHIDHLPEAKVLYERGKVKFNTSMMEFKTMSDGMGVHMIKEYKYISIDELTFPRKINDIDVKVINGPFAIGLKSVVIPNNVHTVGPYSFANNEIETLIIESRDESLTISARAFMKNKLKEFKAHNTIKFIGANAFAENQIEFVDLRKSNVTLVKDAFRANNISRVHLDKAKITYSANFLGKQIPSWTEGRIKATREQFQDINDKVMHLDGQPTGWLALLPQID